MPFYTITIVTTVDETGKPLPASAAGKKAARQVQVWDERNHGQLHTAFAREQMLTVTRLGAQQSPGRPLERRGELTVFFPFLVAIEDDMKLNLSQPEGPKDFMPRSVAEQEE